MKAYDEAHITRAQLLVKILHARVMNELVQVCDALLSDVDPEGLARRTKKGDEEDSDVELLHAEIAAILGDDAVDPEATLDERAFAKAVQVRQEGLDEIGRK
jgi:hypothetical protein